MVAFARDETEIEEITNEAVKRVRIWLGNCRIQMAEETTSTVVMGGRRRLRPIKFRVGCFEKIPGTKAKYLGVRLEKNRTFIQHIKEEAMKAEKTVRIVGSLKNNVGGPKSSRRPLYGG